MNKKIMLVDFGQVVASTGGTEKVLCNLANEFSNRNYDVSIVCCDQKRGNPFFNLNSTVKFINLNDGSLVMEMPFVFKIKREFFRIIGNLDSHKLMMDGIYKKIFKKRFENIIKSMLPDIIICFDRRSLMMIKYVMKIDIPVVFMLHMEASKYFYDGVSETFLNSCNAVECIQVLQRNDVDLVKKFCQDRRIVYIPNMVEMNVQKINFNSYKIIHVGRFSSGQKRQLILIEAFNKIKHKFPMWKIEFFGDMQLEPDYTNKIKNYINDNSLQKYIILNGISSNVNKELYDADIFAFPSKYEGMPLALMEAMSIGLPSVGFKSCSSVNELIIDGKNGFLCDDNVDDFAFKLEILMQDAELRKAFGNNAYDKIKEFSPQHICDIWEKLLKDLGV